MVGDAAFATWEEAELMEVPMVTERGAADAARWASTRMPMGARASGA